MKIYTDLILCYLLHYFALLIIRCILDKFPRFGLFYSCATRSRSVYSFKALIQRETKIPATNRDISCKRNIHVLEH